MDDLYHDGRKMDTGWTSTSEVTCGVCQRARATWRCRRCRSHMCPRCLREPTCVERGFVPLGDILRDVYIPYEKMAEDS